MGDAKPRSLKTLFLLIILLMIVTTQTERVSAAAQQSQYPTMVIINPLSPTNASTFKFNSIDYPINTTFTAAICIRTVTNLTGWQVELTWDNNIINFATAWIPTDNVFKPATDNGATLIPTSPETDYDNLTNTGYLTIGCSDLYTLSYPPFYPVNVETEGLLFYANFTIAVTPNATETLSTNLNILKQLSPNSPMGYFTSFIFIYPSTSYTEVLTEPATVSISGSQAISQTIVAVSVTGISFDEANVYRGDNLTITTSFANNGTDLETFSFNVSETFHSNSVELLRGSMTLLPNATDYYVYTWKIPGNLTVGSYTIEAQIQPLQGQNNTQYNTFSIVIYIDRRISTLEYMGQLISIMLLSPLGIMFMAYVVAVICFFSVLFTRERLKMRRGKIR
ncbi:MAG: hypothetical protein WCD81_00495 [Candidatus Bathyarchaeia archaeon]